MEQIPVSRPIAQANPDIGHSFQPIPYKCILYESFNCWFHRRFRKRHGLTLPYNLHKRTDYSFSNPHYMPITQFQPLPVELSFPGPTPRSLTSEISTLRLRPRFFLQTGCHHLLHRKSPTFPQHQHIDEQ